MLFPYCVSNNNKMESILLLNSYSTPYGLLAEADGGHEDSRRLYLKKIRRVYEKITVLDVGIRSRCWSFGARGDHA
jgi:hypothetical protein